MQKSESIVELSKALSGFQSKVKQPLKDADNPFFKSKYVPLESVVESITDLAPEYGLSFVQWALNDDSGRVGVATMVMHESGEFIEFDPVFMTAEKNTPQGAGSLITYLKRYSLSAIFGITSDQDDDGNSSSGNNTNELNEQITNLFSKALQTCGDKETLYKKIDKTKDDMAKLYKSKNTKAKKEIIEQLEGIANDNGTSK